MHDNLVRVGDLLQRLARMPGLPTGLSPALTAQRLRRRLVNGDPSTAAWTSSAVRSQLPASSETSAFSVSSLTRIASTDVRHAAFSTDNSV